MAKLSSKEQKFHQAELYKCEKCGTVFGILNKKDSKKLCQNCLAEKKDIDEVIKEEHNKKFDYNGDKCATKTDNILMVARAKGIPFKRIVGVAKGEDFGVWQHTYPEINGKKVDVTFDPELESKISKGKMMSTIVLDEGMSKGKTWAEFLQEIVRQIKDEISDIRLINFVMDNPKRIYLYSPTDCSSQVKEICDNILVKCKIKRKTNGIIIITVDK